jgi:integrase/recombinase XerD
MNTSVQLSQPLIQVSRIQDLITRFILAQDVRPLSKSIYTRSIKQFFNWIERNELELNAMTREEIIKYKQDLLDAGHSSLTVAAYITVVRKFYEWTEANKIYPNIAKGVKAPKRQRAFRKSSLMPEQCTRLLNHFEGRPRDYAIINLLLRCGLRTCELVRANIQDIKYKGGRRVLYIQGKGHDDLDAFVCLTPKCSKAIDDYLATRGRYKESEPLFVSVSNTNRGERLTTFTISTICKRGLRAIGLNDRSFTAHSLRHTCAVSILRAGGSIFDAQGVLRHASSTTTQIYVQSINEEQRLKNPAENLIEAQF